MTDKLLSDLNNCCRCHRFIQDPSKTEGKTYMMSRNAEYFCLTNKVLLKAQQFYIASV